MQEDLSRFCCVNEHCPDYGRRGAGNLTVCALRQGRESALRVSGRCRSLGRPCLSCHSYRTFALRSCDA